MTQGVVFSQQVADLLESHFRQLHESSGISVDVIKEREYRSILGKGELRSLGFSRQQCRIPGILMPLWGVDGHRVGYQYRPDKPRQNPKKKPIKYESPPATPNRLDCPPRCRGMLTNPGVPIWICEGTKKADCLASKGQCAISLSGVWSWKGKNQLGGVVILADFDNVAWNGRRANIIPDSDYITNPNVRKAMARLAEHLRRRGADVWIVSIPQEGNSKTGVDDYLSQGHTVDELLTLALRLAGEETQSQERTILAAHLVHNGKLYLEVSRHNGGCAFAYLNNEGRVTLVPEVLTTTWKVRPRTLPEKDGRTIYFVGMPDEDIAGSRLLAAGELYDMIRCHLARYIDLPKLGLELCIYYILFTWIYLKVGTLGYLRFISDSGKGKSRIQKVVGDLCFYPVYASGASSFSGTARQSDVWRGTLIIDECDLEGDKASQFTKYLNLGFERGKYYVLSDKQNPRQQEFFDPFCPKILAMREPFKDSATESRLLSISPHETCDPNIPIILPPSYLAETQRLRNQIAFFILRHWAEVDGNKMLSFDDLRIEPRLKQLAMPLSIIFQVWPEGVRVFRDYLVARQLDIKKMRALSWEGILVNTVIAIATGQEEPADEFGHFHLPNSKEIQAVTPSMIAKQLKSSTKVVTQGLISVGFEVERRWITIYRDGEGTRRQVRAYVVPNPRTWDEITTRYLLGEDDNSIEMPENLRSSKFLVSVHASQSSQVSQNHSVTGVTHETVVQTRLGEDLKEWEEL